MDGWKQTLLRQIPGVDAILENEAMDEMLRKYPRVLVLDSIREAVEDVRSEILGMSEPQGMVETGALLARIAYLVEKKSRPDFRPVINATGIVLHTNLGRALLSSSAAQALLPAAENYTNLEIDLETGQRGSRFSHLESLLARLTGAEAAMVVNNNAAAVLLALNTLAVGREVIVSRGQLVEIGGGFRVPEVMGSSGARLVEVGTTNRTYPEDYRSAINENTALLLSVHTSNYRVIGFTRETTPPELVELGKEAEIPVMEDLGSGSLVKLDLPGAENEPTVQELVTAGVDVITFSGDKLLGGPQAGIIVGRKDFLARMQKNPLARAFRVDKLTVAALEATLREYLRDDPGEHVPVLKMLALGEEQLQARAEELQYRIHLLAGLEAEIVPGISRAGGGALPGLELPTQLVTVQVEKMSCQELAVELRQGEPPVVALVREDRVAFDVRTIRDEELPQVASCLARAIEF